MQQYRQYAPTGFDSKGAFLPERQDWLVLPVIQTRDSGELDQSNFAAALAMLGGEGETVEVHRFGHWGPGWFEIILLNPQDKEKLAVAESIESGLADYPVLDEEDFSRREWESYTEGWESYGASDFVRELGKQFGLSDEAKELLEDCEHETLQEFFEKCNPCGDYYYSESSGVCVNVGSSVRKCSREMLAAFLKSLRHAPVPA